MRALVDDQMTGVAETFGRHLELQPYSGRSLRPEDLGDAEVLLVRSVTRVDASLLAGSRVRFVGSATIGTDHLDTEDLERRGITWAHAPGCNAGAAAQYTLGMMLLACQRMGQDLRDQRVAIVGHGNVGSRLHHLLDALGVAVTACDPPLTEAGRLPEGVSHREAFGCDIVSLHVPYTERGHWATAGMVSDAQFEEMRPGGLLVNTSRGGVVDRAALHRNRAVRTALDVWPDEPAIDEALLASTTVATPHVAGFSVEGKLRGTHMIHDAFLRWLGQPPDATPREAKSPDGVRLPLADRGGDPIAAAVIDATRVAADDARMRAAGPIDAGAFDRLRRAHAPRHEFSAVSVQATSPAAAALAALGFRLSDPESDAP